MSFISRIMTLEPGDLIATGTPDGIGPLVAGDTDPAHWIEDGNADAEADFELLRSKCAPLVHESAPPRLRPEPASLGAIPVRGTSVDTTSRASATRIPRR